MKNQALKLSLFATILCLTLGLSGCGKSGSDSDGGATTADIAALSLIDDKEFAPMQNEDHEAESSGFSVASTDSITNGTQFAFLDTTLTVNNNKIIYNSNEFTLDFIFEDEGRTYTNFARAISSSNTVVEDENIQISTGQGLTCNIKFSTRTNTTGNTSETTMRANGKVFYTLDNDNTATIELSNCEAFIENEVIDNTSHTTLNQSFPFVLTINNLQYTGTLISNQVQVDGEFESGDQFAKSTLSRNGTVVGELLLDNDGKMQVRIKNEDGKLVDI
jgi:hypothetical protein